MGLSGSLWPVHLKPKEDELLSSWLVRLAKAHGLKAQTFCKFVWPEKPILFKNIDKCQDNEVLQTLSEKTATPYERVFETTLKSYEGSVFGKYDPQGYIFWLIPIGAFRWRKRSLGSQFCIYCLVEDEDPYYRKKWRLAFVVACEKHDKILIDSCSKCGFPLNYLSIDAGSKPQTACMACGFNLLDASSPSRDLDDKLLINNQIILLKIVKSKWFYIDGHQLCSHRFFDALHFVIELLINGKESARIRKGLCKDLELPDVFEFYSNGRNYFESMSLKERAVLLAMTYWLLDEWPDRLVFICREINASYNNLLKNIGLNKSLINSLRTNCFH